MICWKVGSIVVVDVLFHRVVLGVDDVVLDLLGFFEVSHHEQQQILELIVLWLCFELKSVVNGDQGLVIAFAFLTVAEEEGSILIPIGRRRLAYLCSMLELPLSI